MIFRYPEQSSAYRMIQKAARRNGLHAEPIGLNTGEGGLLLGYDLSDRSRTIVISKRKRGWVLTIQGVCFHLPNEHEVLATSHKLLDHLSHSNSPADLSRLGGELGCTFVPWEKWCGDEAMARQIDWIHFGWEHVDDEAATNISSKFFDWHSQFVSLPVGIINREVPSRTWDLREVSMAPRDISEELESELTMAFLDILRRTVSPDHGILALSPYRACYRFNPHAPIDTATRNQWALPILPLEHDLFFFCPDLSFGLLGHYGPNTLTAFGNPLLQTLASENLKTLSRPVPLDIRWSQIEWKKRIDWWSDFGWQSISDGESRDLSRTYQEIFGDLDMEPFSPSIVWDMKDICFQNASSITLLEIDLADKIFSAIRCLGDSGEGYWIALQNINPCCRFDPTPLMDRLAWGQTYFFVFTLRSYSIKTTH